MLYVVEIRRDLEQLASVMPAIREWLDAQRFEPDVFRSDQASCAGLNLNSRARHSLARKRSAASLIRMDGRPPLLLLPSTERESLEARQIGALGQPCGSDEFPPHHFPVPGLGVPRAAEPDRRAGPDPTVRVNRALLLGAGRNSQRPSSSATP
jgi:hypothetical protein